MSRLDGDFETDFEWQAQFLQHQREIAVKALRVDVAPIEDDLKRNTDLVLKSAVPMHAGHPLRISARVRRCAYRRHSGNFTIRDRRPSGAQTEMAKVRLGDGDMFIYGFDSGDGPLPCLDCDTTHHRMYPWFIGNLHLLRDYDMQGGYRELRRNKGPYGSQLAVFYHADMPFGFAIDSDGLPVVDHESVWGQCRNRNWDDPNKPRRNGFCNGEFVTPLTDDLTMGTGYWRLCMACGFRWRAGWEMRLTRPAP
jgi:hypothetical protein